MYADKLKNYLYKHGLRFGLSPEQVERRLSALMGAERYEGYLKLTDRFQCNKESNHLAATPAISILNQPCLSAG